MADRKRRAARKRHAEIVFSLHHEGSAGEGLSVPAIARETGLSTTYVSELLSDPSGTASRKAKRQKYHQLPREECPGCGTEISPRADTCPTCQPRLLAVWESKVVDGCYDRRPPAKRCSGCHRFKAASEYNSQKGPVKGRDGEPAKALYLRGKCKACQSIDNRAAIFRRAVKHGRVPRSIFMRELQRTERYFTHKEHREQIGFREALSARAKVSLKLIFRIERGYEKSRRKGVLYKSPVRTVDIVLLEHVLMMRDMRLQDLPEWEFIITEGKHYTYIGWESETGSFRERAILPPSRRKKPKRRAKTAHQG